MFSGTAAKVTVARMLMGLRMHRRSDLPALRVCVCAAGRYDLHHAILFNGGYTEVGAWACHCVAGRCCRASHDFGLKDRKGNSSQAGRGHPGMDEHLVGTQARTNSLTSG